MLVGCLRHSSSCARVNANFFFLLARMCDLGRYDIVVQLSLEEDACAVTSKHQNIKISFVRDARLTLHAHLEPCLYTEEGLCDPLESCSAVSASTPPDPNYADATRCDNDLIFHENLNTSNPSLCSDAGILLLRKHLRPSSL